MLTSAHGSQSPDVLSMHSRALSFLRAIQSSQHSDQALQPGCVFPTLNLEWRQNHQSQSGTNDTSLAD